jgi:hypothetical protein
MTTVILDRAVPEFAQAAQRPQDLGPDDVQRSFVLRQLRASAYDYSVQKFGSRTFAGDLVPLSFNALAVRPTQFGTSPTSRHRILAIWENRQDA